MSRNTLNVFVTAINRRWSETPSSRAVVTGAGSGAGQRKSVGEYEFGILPADLADSFTPASNSTTSSTNNSAFSPSAPGRKKKMSSTKLPGWNGELAVPSLRTVSRAKST